MATRTRVWLNSPYHNANDRYAYLLSSAQITEFEMYRENNVHINYADDLNMSCVTIPNIDVFNQKPNYCVIFNGVQVESHWFVTSYAFISGEQTSNRSKNAVTLSRDVVVDFKDNIKRATTKIQQGQIPDTYSTLAVANEPVVLNKIKTGEVTIQDKFANTEWAAIYYDSSQEHTLQILPTGSEPANLNYSAIQNSTWFGPRTTITSTGIVPAGIPIFKRRLSTAIAYCSIRYRGTFGGMHDVGSVRIRLLFSANSAGVITDVTRAGTTIETNDGYTDNSTLISEANSLFDMYMMNTFDYPGMDPAGEKKTLIDIANANYVFDNTALVNSEVNQLSDKLVTLPASEGSANVARTRVAWTQKTPTITSPLGLWDSWARFQANVPTEATNTYVLQTSYMYRDLVVVDNEVTMYGDVSYSNLALTLPQGVTLSDINCGCVVVPFGDITIDGQGLSRDTISRLLTSSITAAGTSAFFDIQILPYCPVRYLEKTLQGKNINTSLMAATEAENCINIVTNNTTLYKAFVVRNSNDSVILSMPQNEILNPTSDIKKHTIADRVRFMAPNNGSSFEITPTRNYGITEIIIEWTVRPVKPFYRVYPSFGGLYGDDYNDGRGLFLEGGFSLSQVSSLWQNYQLNNSTYKQVFDREITSLELSNGVAQQKQQIDLNYSLMSAQAQKDAAYAKGIAGIVMGGVGGGVGGAMAGAKAGPVGAVVGGITGTIGGVAGGVANLAIDQQLRGQLIDYTRQQGQQMVALDNQLRAESISYKQDMFRMSNQSMIAAPNTMIRGSDLTINNRGKVYLETYSCTLEEWAYLNDYLRLRGHTIERFGALKDYLINDMDYIEATLLFIPGVLPHVSSAINAELNAGKFVQGGLFND